MAVGWLRFVWPLLGLCTRLHASQNPRPPLDLLLPYTGPHGPSHSHRHVRDCQPLLFGNSTHETWKADATQGEEARSSVFVTDVKSSSGPRWVYGHMTVVQDPLRTLSVLEPGGVGGCGLNHLTPVETTAQSGGCIYAQNAGFFNTSKGQCLGNVISEGRLVRSSGGVQNAQFGIRRDGSLVFGYLSEEEVLDQKNPFVQLVSGVMWLLRDGQVYINHSLQAECDETQETGALRHFVDVISARTVVGHDAQGRVLLVHIDGQTELRGMNLWEMADFLKEHNVINAINLDGGGSSTFVKNGSLASYPSDHCIPDSRWRCARAVSTVLCVHPRRCEAGCRGRCESGVCVCEAGWSGDLCERAPCEDRGCGRHGMCTHEGCVCDAGWIGHNCSRACPSGLYGDGCNQSCSCVRGSCDAVHGLCSCPPGFTGDSCQNVCPQGSFGLSCSQICNCSDSCFCDAVSGQCSTTFTPERNATLHTVEQCLADHMFKSWIRDERSTLEQHYLSERSWLIFGSALLLLLLCISVSLHLLTCCRASSLSSAIARPYAYIPLQHMDHSVPAEEMGNDSESEDEVWTPQDHR